jgi:hypothetical protein
MPLYESGRYYFSKKFRAYKDETRDLTQARRRNGDPRAINWEEEISNAASHFGTYNTAMTVIDNLMHDNGLVSPENINLSEMAASFSSPVGDFFGRKFKSYEDYNAYLDDRNLFEGLKKAGRPTIDPYCILAPPDLVNRLRYDLMNISRYITLLENNLEELWTVRLQEKRSQRRNDERSHPHDHPKVNKKRKASQISDCNSQIIGATILKQTERATSSGGPSGGSASRQMKQRTSEDAAAFLSRK